uniref:G-protein coupled receptors family 1 profile domain-containing protein n=1 Tax=Acrobeloides nanus TaxID=290746 RepID=A0A914CVE8_9BILA
MLVFSDLLLAIGVLIRGIYAAYATQQGIRKFSVTPCLIINNVIQGAGMGCSQICILGIFIDRFMAIYRPIAYSKRQNMTLFKFIVVLSVLYASCAIFLAYFQVDTTKLIDVCSAGAAAGPYLSYLSLSAGSTITILLFCLYFSTLFILFRYERSRNIQTANALKFQRKVFVSASLVLLCYTIFWVGPFTFNILSIVFNYDKNTRSYVSVAVGFGNAINAGCSVFVYLFKYPMINECAKAVLLKKTNIDKVTNVFSVQNNGIKNAVSLTRK